MIFQGSGDTRHSNKAITTTETGYRSCIPDIALLVRDTRSLPAQRLALCNMALQPRSCSTIFRSGEHWTKAAQTCLCICIFLLIGCRNQLKGSVNIATPAFNSYTTFWTDLGCDSFPLTALSHYYNIHNIQASWFSYLKSKAREKPSRRIS